MQFYVFDRPDDPVLSCWHVLEHGDAQKTQGQHGQPVGFVIALILFTENHIIPVIYIIANCY